jgi:phage terminase Nu1 subunit (DNA packaging protein)
MGLAEQPKRMEVNKQELSDILGVSVVTVSDWIRRKYGDSFPVVSRGGNGREWSFDPDQVKAFLARVRDEAQQAEIERNAALRQYMLPMAQNGASSEEPSLAQPIRPQDELMMMKVRRMRREEAYHEGRLIEVARFDEMAEEMFTTWRRLLDEAVLRLATDHDLAPELVADMTLALNGCKRELVSIIRAKAAKQREMFDQVAAE